MILVIGATSFIGHWVVKKLIENNFTVRCLVRTDSNIEKLRAEILSYFKNHSYIKDLNSKFEFVSGNLLSPDSIYHSLKNIKAVVYLVDLKNTTFVKNIIEVLLKTQIKRAVFLGSTTVLVPLDSQIKQAKIESEKLIEKSNLDWTILRASMIYGSPDDKNFSSMLNFILKKNFFVVFGKGNNLIQPVYIEDVANSIMVVINNERTIHKIYSICGPQPIKYIDMLKIVQKKLGQNFKIIKLPAKLSRAFVSLYCKINKNSKLTPDMIDRMQIDKSYSIMDAVKDFNFNPIDFETGIEKLIKHIKAN